MKGMNIEVEFEQGSDGRWIADIPAIPGAIAMASLRKKRLSE